MFVKIVPNPFRTMTGRLTVSYGILSGASSILLVMALYYILLFNVYEYYDNLMYLYLEEVNKVFQQDGITKLQQVLQEDDGTSADLGYIQLIDRAGTVLASSKLGTWSRGISDPNIWSKLQKQSLVYQTLTSSANQNRFRTLHWKIDEDQMLYMAVQLPRDSVLASDFINISLLLVGISIICGCGIGWFLAWCAMAGVKKVTATASYIGEGNLDARVPRGKQPEEIDHLASTFNMMIDRIDYLMKEVKDVSNVIAHDLRSPLTRIRGCVEVALRGKEDPENYKVVMANVIEECDKLESMINTLLEIAELESGVNITKLEAIDLKSILLDAEDLFVPLAEAKQQQLSMSTPPSSIRIKADRSRLQRTIASLLDNAIKYTPNRGKIEIIVQNKPKSVCITIKDSGSGIPPEDLHKVFDPFFRCDKSRTMPGNGLGLSYVKAIVNYHCGQISINCPQEGGTEIHLIFPGFDE